jgi:hypothetical protein
MSQALVQATDAVAVTPSDSSDLANVSVLYVGVGGHVKVTTRAGSDIIFYNLNNGQFVPVQVRKVFASDTTATNLVAMPVKGYLR